MEYAEKRKKFQADERYRKLVEDIIQKDPTESMLKYSLAFYRIGTAWPGAQDTLFFPVRILKGRKSFGKLQCLITPLVPEAHVFDAPLGERWVDRKFLILNHDHDFERYKEHLPKEDDSE